MNKEKEKGNIKNKRGEKLYAITEGGVAVLVSVSCTEPIDAGSNAVYERKKMKMGWPNNGRPMGSSNYMPLCATNKVSQLSAQDLNGWLFWALPCAAHVRNSGQNFLFFSRWTTKI